MQITYKLTEDDQKKYISANFQPKNKNILLRILLIVLLTLSIVLFGLEEQIFATAFLVIDVVCFLLYFILPKSYKTKYIKNLDNAGVLNESKTIDVKDDELLITSPSRSTAYKYSDVASVSVISTDFIMLKFKHGDSLLLPISAFDSSAEKTEFINTVKLKAQIL